MGKLGAVICTAGFRNTKLWHPQVVTTVAKSNTNKYTTAVLVCHKASSVTIFQVFHFTYIQLSCVKKRKMMLWEHNNTQYRKCIS